MNSEEYKCCASGITLIALIITIIILLILAGITINLTIGKHGILKQAQQAGTIYEESSAREKLEIALVDLQSQKASDEQYNENIENYFKEHDIHLKENIATVNGWCFIIDRDKLEIKENLGKLENVSINNIIGRQLSADFRKTLNGYTATKGNALADSTLGLLPKTYVTSSSIWNQCCYEKTIDKPFDLSQKFNIEFNSRQITSTAHQMGGMEIRLQKKNESDIYENVMQISITDDWESYVSIQVGFYKNSQSMYSNKISTKTYNVKIVGNGNSIEFYLNGQCVAIADQEKDISIDKVSIIFLQYPNHGELDENSLESIYFGGARE